MLSIIYNKLVVMLWISVFIMMFVGCSIPNEGKVDFRRTNTSHSLVEDANRSLVKKSEIISKTQIENLIKNYKPMYRLIDINISNLSKNKNYKNIDEIYTDLNISDSKIEVQVNSDLNESNETLYMHIDAYIKYLNDYNKSKYHILDENFNACSNHILSLIHI